MHHDNYNEKNRSCFNRISHYSKPGNESIAVKKQHDKSHKKHKENVQK